MLIYTAINILFVKKMKKNIEIIVWIILDFLMMSPPSATQCGRSLGIIYS